jgi:hypothetical protein
MAATDQVRRLRVETSVTGAEQAKIQISGVSGALDNVGKSSEAAARASQRYEEQLARGQRMLAQQMQMMEQFDRQLQNITRREMEHRSALAATAEGFRAMAAAAAAHPVLLAAGAAATTRALSATAAGLEAASVATRAYANDNAAMGRGAGLVARGLQASAEATAAASTSLEGYLGATSRVVMGTRLVSAALGVVAPILGVIGTGLLAIRVGADVLSKASGDYEKLVRLGERAEALDLSGNFVKSFEGLGKTLHLEVDQMDAALTKASAFVRDSLGQQNKLQALLDDLEKQGFAGGDRLRGSVMLDSATTTEQRIRAGVEAMKEFEERGLKLAALRVGENLFPAEVVERLRTGRTTAAEIAEELDAAAQKKIVDQDSVDRALALSRATADVKREISAALETSFDFSSISQKLGEAWLAILERVRDVVVKLNDGITAGLAGLANIGTRLEQLGNASLWRRLADVLPKLPGNGGVVDAPPGGFEMQGPPRSVFQPMIGSRITPEMFGPKLSEMADLAKKSGEVAKNTGDTLSTLDRYLIDLKKSAEVAQTERDLFFASNKEREVAVDLVKARAAAEKDVERGLRDTADLTEEEVQKVTRWAEKMAQVKEETRLLNDGLNAAFGAGNTFFSTFASSLVDGKNAMQAMAASGRSLASSLSSQGFSRLFSKETLSALKPGGDATQAVSAAGAAGGGALMGIGLQRGSMLMSVGGAAVAGAAMGLPFGPEGAAVGAVIGAGVGLLSSVMSQGAAKQQRLLQIQQAMLQQQQEAAQAQSSGQQRSYALQDTRYIAGQDPDTLVGALAIFERQAFRQRQAEMQAGGQAMVELEANIAEGREGVIKDFKERAMATEKDLGRSLNDLQDRGFLNDISDLFDKVANMRVQGLDTAKIDQFFTLSAQKVVDDAHVAGDAFHDEFLAFP